MKPSYKFSKLPISDIVGGWCDKKEVFYEEMKFHGYKIDKLVESIKKNGIINPIIVRDTQHKYRKYRYLTLDGSHRLRVLKDIHREKEQLRTDKDSGFNRVIIPVYIVENLTEKDYFEDVDLKIIQEIKEKYYKKGV